MASNKVLSLSCTTSSKQNPRRPSRHASSPQPLSDTDPLSNSEISSNRALKFFKKRKEISGGWKFKDRYQLARRDIAVNEATPSALFVQLTRLKERNVPIFGHGIGRDLERIGTNFRLTL